MEERLLVKLTLAEGASARPVPDPLPRLTCRTRAHVGSTGDWWAYLSVEWVSPCS
jgi:hypothetical protein